MKMTEKEFMQRVAEELESCPVDPVARVIARIAKEAGLEFAPEPVELPERVVLATTGLSAIVDAPGGGYVAHFPASELGKAYARTSTDRYNAYPGLRRALERLVASAWGDNSIGQYSRALAEAEAELAKGPK